MIKCYACGEPIRRGYPMVTNKRENVIICERCKRLWKKAKAELGRELYFTEHRNHTKIGVL